MLARGRCEHVFVLEKSYLERCLLDGMSLEAIAAEAGCHHSNVSYWLRRHGLQAVHAEQFAPKGAIDADRLADLIAEGLTQGQIAERLGRSASTVGYWLRRHHLKTQRAQLRGVPPRERPAYVERDCTQHGLTRFVQTGSDGHYRCLRCRSERVARRRRELKAILVREAGERCMICGYGRFVGALHFHHLDPAGKEFGIALGGVARSLAKVRKEACKCVLLCANCHAEVEAGVTALPLELRAA